MDPLFTRFLPQAKPDPLSLMADHPGAAAALAGSAQAVAFQELLPLPHADSRELPQRREGDVAMASGASDWAGRGATADLDASGHASTSAAEAGRFFSMPTSPPSSLGLLEFPSGREGLSLLLSVAGLFHVARPVPVPGLWSNWSRCMVHTMASSVHKAARMPLPARVSSRSIGTSKVLARQKSSSTATYVYPTAARCRARIPAQNSRKGFCQVKMLQSLASIVLRKYLCSIA